MRIGALKYYDYNKRKKNRFLKSEKSLHLKVGLLCLKRLNIQLKE